MSTTTDTALRKVYLIKVEPGVNNNKYYNMEELGDGTWKATYARVGAPNPAVKIYPMSDWDKKYKEKLRGRNGEKPYVDKTHLFTEEITKDSGKSTITEITDKVVAQLVKELQGYAKVSVEKNYIVSSEKVTQKMVDEAQTLVDEITNMLKIGQDVEPINKILIDLFQVIPRKMAHVKDYLFEGDLIKNATSLAAAQQLIGQEQATLDVMAGQVSTHSKTDIKSALPSANTILEAMGLIIVEAPKTDIPLIKDLMGSNAKQFKRAYQVTNKRTQERFDKALKTYSNKSVELFWHGSRNENWWSIMDKGWMLRPANAVISGKMFGYGIYWADKFQKSLGYTSLSGSYWAGGRENKAFLSISSVHVGNQLHIKRHEGWCSGLDLKSLRGRGDYDSVFAHGGADLRNNEFIIYTEPQCTIKYLVEVSH